MQENSTPSSDLQQLFRNLAVARVFDQLNAEPLWRVTAKDGQVLLYERSTGLLWDALPSRETKMDLAKATEIVTTLKLGGLQHWRVPTLQELKHFAAYQKASIRSTQSLTGFHTATECWLTTSGTWTFDTFVFNEGPQHWGILSAVNDFVGDINDEEFIDLCLERDWALTLSAEQNSNLLSAVKTPSAPSLFADVDYLSARLPRLEDAYFKDPTRGLWELWGHDQKSLQAFAAHARNPADDVVDWDVAIDFGTSSTVVAYNEHGRRKLLRVGMDRFWEADQPEHYENPTALEFVNLDRMLANWRVTAYRPAVLWDDVHCSHTALKSLDAPEARHKLVPSVLTGMKQWALRGEHDPQMYVRGAVSGEHALTPLTARNPVLGAPLQVSPDDPFDPIELYAWFLGMNINWRGRGIFLRYYMSFPVSYPEQVRDKILASFRRGLQRSLPVTLVNQAVFSKFRVEELATEPAAYAAAALPALAIEPTPEGVAYAVFDFGGGTTDFEFGRYRLPNDEEDDELEEVLEHLGASGDVFLGGEHLLANMAYLVFQHNQELCRKLGITFLKPQDADDFPGHEMYVENSRIAATNSAVLIAALRPLWEKSLHDGVSNCSIRLLDRSGADVDCQLTIPVDELNSYLVQRIGQGIQSFFLAMRKAFGDSAPPIVHVLLAGNASRSSIVQSYFFSESGSELFGEAADFFSDAYDGGPTPEIVVHRAPDGEVPYPAMGKTGVALGLLRLCPGGAVLTKSAIAEVPEREAPFAYFVGRIRRGKFEPTLLQTQPYGEWADLGSPRDRVLKLAFTRSPLALAGAMAEGDRELAQRRLEFSAISDGKRVFARAVGPHEIELGVAPSLTTLQEGLIEELQRISLL